jgi:hypothetical protein
MLRNTSYIVCGETEIIIETIACSDWLNPTRNGFTVCCHLKTMIASVMKKVPDQGLVRPWHIELDSKSLAKDRRVGPLQEGRIVESSACHVLRHMRHQELWRAVGTHYGQTRIYGPTFHLRDGTAGTPELLQQLPQPGLGDDYLAGPCRRRQSPRDLHESTLGRLCSWRSVADEDRSDAVRRDRRLRDRREQADASVQKHGTRTAVQVNSTRHALGIYYSD